MDPILVISEELLRLVFGILAAAVFFSAVVLLHLKLRRLATLAFVSTAIVLSAWFPIVDHFYTLYQDEGPSAGDLTLFVVNNSTTLTSVLILLFSASFLCSVIAIRRT